MARPGFHAAGIALLLAACAGAPHKASVPEGLEFRCDSGALASVTFNDGGYLPESNALGRTREGALVQAPRSTATLHYADGRYPMLAEWAELGLRYRATEPGPDGRHMILSLRGEEALVGRRAETPGPDEAAEGERVAQCRRSGRTADRGHHGEAHAAPHAEDATRRR